MIMHTGDEISLAQMSANKGANTFENVDIQGRIFLMKLEEKMVDFMIKQTTSMSARKICTCLSIYTGIMRAL